MTDQNKSTNPKGAGRKAGITFVSDADRIRTRGVTLKDDQYAKFKKLGGSKWLRKLLDENK